MLPLVIIVMVMMVMMVLMVLDDDFRLSFNMNLYINSKNHTTHTLIFFVYRFGSSSSFSYSLSSRREEDHQNSIYTSINLKRIFLYL